MKKQWLHNDETLESALTHLYYTTYSQVNVLNFQGTYGNGILIKSSIRRATHDIDYCTNMEAGKRCVGRDCVYVSRKERS